MPTSFSLEKPVNDLVYLNKRRFWSPKPNKRNQADYLETTGFFHKRTELGEHSDKRGYHGIWVCECGETIILGCQNAVESVKIE